MATGVEVGPRSRARRIISFPLVLLLLAMLAVAIGIAVGTLIAQAVPAPQESPAAFLKAVIYAACVVAAYCLFVRYIEREPVRDFERRGWAAELLGGLALGLVAFSSVVGVVALLGGFSIAGPGRLASIWPALSMVVVSSVGEEVVFRGILFRFIERTAGSWVALLLTSLLFGGAHLANPNASLASAAAIAAEGGIMLGALYMLTRRLWAVIGLHAAWNFTQGWIFGLPVSGIDSGGILRGVLTGPELLTGGAFGLEASLPAVVIATSAGLLLLHYAHKKGRFIKPLWSRNGAEAAASAERAA